jgi:hypothetical protein
MENNKPKIDRECDFINSVGTSFWAMEEFDGIIDRLSKKLKVVFAEDEDDQRWSYVLVEENGILFESQDKDEIWEILREALRTAIEDGLVGMD